MKKITYNLKSLNRILRAEKPSRICLVTSATLLKKLGWAIKEIDAGLTFAFVPDGEDAKKWDVLHSLLKQFVKHSLDRNSIIIALGGGAIGDLAGFAASIYLRGIRYIQIPTTLVAQVDSAHGGKTGINFLHLKNQVGSFHPPLATIIDPRFLKSLKDEQVIDGLGEIIKAGFIKDKIILNLLEKETVKTLLTSKRLPEIIERSIKVKLHYVSHDFNDTGDRLLLNFGHTIGHAVELEHGISHGKAVLIGMLQELELTESLGLTKKDTRLKLTRLLSHMGIFVDEHLPYNRRSILHDKKIQNDSVKLPIIIREGRAELISLKVKALL